MRRTDTESPPVVFSGSRDPSGNASSNRATVSQHCAHSIINPSEVSHLIEHPPYITAGMLYLLDSDALHM
jgi:hypothetical protein